MQNTIKSLIVMTLVGGVSTLGFAQAAASDLEQVTVIGVSPLSQGSQTLNTQFADESDFERVQSSTLTDFLDQGFLGVTLNHAQNNPLQPDLLYRGFAASPALGLQQGMTVYQNGVRLNESFGETVNWDLISDNTISDIQLVPGGNPLFGLNSLGGALVLNTKTGFTSPGNEVSASVGSFARKTASASIGGSSSDKAYFVSLDAWDEDGWRDFSESEALNFYSALSWHLDNGTKLDLFYNHADTDLKGNGASPVELLELSRSAVFTHPDRTENNLDMLNLTFEKDLGSNQKLNANMFFRRNTTTGFNGDGSTYGECDDDDFEDFLCIGEDDDDDDLEELAHDDDDDDDELEDDDEELVLLFDQNGDLISSDFDAINNLSERKQRSYGANLEWSALVGGGDIQHNIIAGVSYLKGRTTFSSSVELASLNDDRSTNGSGLFDPAAATYLLSESETIGLYVSDTIEVGDRMELTLAARYNDIEIVSEDLSGFRPALDAESSFSRLNLGISPTIKLSADTRVFLSWGQSMRSPSPVELACSHPDAPCTLPNTFLADPPLNEVVSTTYEIGFKGRRNNVFDWRLGAFHITNEDDIMFQTTGGVSSNVGFFDNVGDTQRVGLEFGLSGSGERSDWYLNYTFLQATFEDEFVSSSPNHPLSDEGGVLVTAGSSLPGIPEHNLSLGGKFNLSSRFTLGAQASFASGQFLRGDEANLLGELDSYSVVDMNLSYRASDSLKFAIEVENVFDTEYSSFGLLGEPDEIFEEFENPVFLSSNSPRGAWFKASYKW